MQGTWGRYFKRWREMTIGEIDPYLLDLVEPLRRFVPPARLVDKRVYSPFHGTILARELHERGSVGVLVLDASPLARIEDDYGATAYEEVVSFFLPSPGADPQPEHP